MQGSLAGRALGLGAPHPPGVPQAAGVARRQGWRRTLRVSASRELPKQPVELPGGALWWLGAATSGAGDIPGGGFVLQRQKIGGEGLVRVQGPRPVPQPYARRPQHLARQPRAAPGAGLTLAGASLAAGCVVIDTTFQEVAPPQPCLGIVPVSSGSAGGEAPADNPRRTRRVQFTCNLCGTQNQKRTNPHAWRSGSVFARCSGCTAVHKLVDNLEIFHEGGPVFPPPELRSTFLSQEVMDRIAQYRRAPGMDN